MRGCALWFCALCLGCSAEDDVATSGASSDCAAGEWRREDGRCVPSGLPPDMPCPPGQWLREGVCIPAGVPSDGCGEGFAHDMDSGCEPILPAEDCADGFMAIPGETACREVAPCAAGDFGDIPVEPDTEYVNASYMGGASDGSQAAPWTTIQAGIDAALPGAIVAVAAGSYVEDLDVDGKPVRLWGRCPGLVELSGTGVGLAALFISVGADGSEVRRLSITGEALGVLLSGSEDVVFDEVRIHDNMSRGLNAQDSYGSTSFSLKRSLLEQNHELAVFVGGSAGTVETTVVRDTTLALQGFGRAICAQASPRTGARASVTVMRSLLERNYELGIYVEGSDASVDSVVVRDTMPGGQGIIGRGIGAQTNPVSGARASLHVARSVIERSHETGVMVSGSDATVEATVVRDGLPNGQRSHGYGMVAQIDPEMGTRASVTLLSSLLENNHELGMQVAGSDATVETTVVRDTLPGAMGLGGRALQVEHAPEFGAAASVALHTSLFERNVEAAIFIAGAVTAELDACLVRDTKATGEGLLGDGLLVASYAGPASAITTATRIENSARAAISSFGATVALGSSLLVCQQFDIGAEIMDGQAAVFDDRGGVLCGCPDANEGCKAQSYALAPPPPPE